MLPFEDIPDDLVPLTAHMKELLNHATTDQPLLICLDSVDQLVGSQDGNKMSWLPTKLPLHCKIIVSCTKEGNNAALCQDYELLTKMIESKENFLEVRALGDLLAWKVIKLWMETAGRDLNNYQWRVVANAVAECSLPIFCKLVSCLLNAYFLLDEFDFKFIYRFLLRFVDGKATLSHRRHI
jgi:hypothetical protein